MHAHAHANSCVAQLPSIHSSLATMHACTYIYCYVIKCCELQHVSYNALSCMHMQLWPFICCPQKYKNTEQRNMHHILQCSAVCTC